MINHFQLTEHARCRASQRGLKLADIRYTLQFGHCYYVGDAFIYYLRRVDIPNADYPRMKRLEGTAVIAAREEACIITVWRNRKNGLRNIRRKLAQIWRKEREVMGDE